MSTANRPGSAASSDDPLAGTRYTCERKLGRGGMGDVWAALDTNTSMRVCVKLMRAEPEMLAQAEDRFRTEQRVLGMLAGHPHIVSCRDVGTTPEGVPFMVLELLEGESLRMLLKRRGSIPAAEAVPILITLLRTLAWVHDRGVVHRDLKPDNVFLEQTPRGHVLKLLDFGIAKLVRGDLIDRIAPAFKTQEGAFIGTLRFGSPEQAMGKPVDARSDLYSCGLLLHALLTGASPFADIGGIQIVALVDRMQEEDFGQRLLEKVPDLPRELVGAIVKALAFDRDQRFQSANAFAEALAAITFGAAKSEDDDTTRLVERVVVAEDRPEEPGHPPKPLRARPRALAAVIVVAIVLTMFLGGIAMRVLGLL